MKYALIPDKTMIGFILMEDPFPATPMYYNHPNGSAWLNVELFVNRFKCGKCLIIWLFNDKVCDILYDVVKGIRGGV